jgi:hypothetical protein
MAFIVVYDANVLYPNTLRDLLIRIAQLPHIVQAKWTDEILDEMLEALRKNRPDIRREGQPPAGADDRGRPGLPYWAPPSPVRSGARFRTRLD